MPPRKLKTVPAEVVEPTLPSEPVSPVIVRKERKDVVIPLLVGAIIVAAFAVGYLYGQNTILQSNKNLAAGGTGGTAAAQVNPAGDQAAPTVTKDQVKALFTDKKNIVFGNPNSKVLFVEFSDPSCPYCHIAGGKNPELNAQVGDRFKLNTDGGSYVAPVPEMKKLVDQGKAAYVWMFSPGHGNGELGTQALYCAEDQGKFWQVNDLLMSNKGYTLLNETVKNDTTKIPQLVDFLKSVVKAADLQNCLTSGKYADRVKSDEAVSRQFGVQGTPSFFVNDKNFGGAYSFTDIQPTVEAALK